jgi:hypothetical protein
MVETIWRPKKTSQLVMLVAMRRPEAGAVRYSASTHGRNSRTASVNMRGLNGRKPHRPS